MKLNWQKIGMFAGAVVLGVIIHRIVSKALGMDSATETMFGAHGTWGCQAGNSPTFPAGTYACNYMACCENGGGTVDYTSHGNGTGSIGCMGYSGCNGGNRLNVTEPVRPVKMTRKFRW